jgi:hypothetical protein
MTIRIQNIFKVADEQEYKDGNQGAIEIAPDRTSARS